MKWIRQTHRVLAITFTATVIFTSVALALGSAAEWVNYVPLFPLAFLFFSGLYLFVSPYTAKRRSRRSQPS